VNPVEIWEGIDTQEEISRNCLTKFAIHILSVVASSAGCKRAFSHMGLVHTSIHRKLGVEKVCKATMVEMDIKQMHLDAGLLHAWGKQNLTPQEPDATPQANYSDISNNNLLNFDQLYNHLIVGAVFANNDKDAGDDNDDLPTTVLAPH
jgi:hAT family C-terminal dimerisation region